MMMAFCTIVEWDGDLDPRHFKALAESAGVQDELPAGCVSRVFGHVGTGACVIGVWQTGDDAKRFSEQSKPKIGVSELPPPTRVVGFETEVFLAR
jgi:hypothetical protein